MILLSIVDIMIQTINLNTRMTLKGITGKSSHGKTCQNYIVKYRKVRVKMNKKEIEKAAFNINAPKVKNIIGKKWVFNFEGGLTTKTYFDK